MSTYQVECGEFHDGQTGKTYQRGEKVTSSMELDKMFPNTFARLKVAEKTKDRKSVV